MEIKIDCDEKCLIITDDGFNVDNFINIKIGEEGKIGQDADVPIEELYTAVQAFYEKRLRGRQADNLIK